MNERPAVWILGAGFSRSLGGPLLTDLLSPPTNNFVSAVYRENSFIGLPEGDANLAERAAALDVRLLYQQCGGSTAEEGKRFWDDAEAFLDQLDAAAHGGPESPAYSRIRNAFQIASAYNGEFGDVKKMRDAARRLVAAACCAFVKDADTSEERWQPYTSWARRMTPTDTIVTFNYDRVPEKLNAFDVVLPHPTAPVEDGAFRPQLLKLHGSVDWHREARDGIVTFRDTKRDEYAIECDGEAIGLATPGPTKRLAAKEAGSLWDGAKRRIRAAEVIVFVGFRFPPSDAEAREQLLKAIGENSSTHVELHIVLGPERSHRDVVRLEQLLRYVLIRNGRDEIVPPRIHMQLSGAVKTFAVTTHPLYAEDFFSVWHRGLLWPASLEIVKRG
jgi:hypothetical protein